MEALQFWTEEWQGPICFHLFFSTFYSLAEAFSNMAFWAENSMLLKAVLCIVGSSAASLVSTN